MEENIEGEVKNIRQRRTTNDWETLGIKFLNPTEEDFDEILDFKEGLSLKRPPKSSPQGCQCNTSTG